MFKQKFVVIWFVHRLHRAGVVFRDFAKEFVKSQPFANV